MAERTIARLLKSLGPKGPGVRIPLPPLCDVARHRGPDVARHRRPLKPLVSLGLVVPAGIEPQTPQRGSVQGDDLDVEAVDEHGQPPAPEGFSDADVVESAPVAKRHSTVIVDLVESKTPSVG